jgi:hypothetical protein
LLFFGKNFFHSTDELESSIKEQKRKRLGQPRQALEGLEVKSFFDFIGRTEATSRG